MNDMTELAVFDIAYLHMALVAALLACWMDGWITSVDGLHST